MRFTKRQQNIIRKIESGHIWDIHSFVNAFQPRRTAQYDWEQVQRSFAADPDVTAYYYPKNLEPTPANRIREDVFIKKQRQGELSPDTYARLSPRLDKTCAQQQVCAMGKTFTFDFYQGVQVADSFDELVEFLAIWQFLRAHALVLEVHQPLTAETVGLFFQQEDPAVPPSPTPEKRDGVIHFPDCRYLAGRAYCLSEDHLAVCQEFLGRRLYPAPGLKLFVQNRFRTQDEISQQRSLTAAWVAIVVSLLIGLAPYFLPSQLSDSLRPDRQSAQQASGQEQLDNTGDEAAAQSERLAKISPFS